MRRRHSLLPVAALLVGAVILASKNGDAPDQPAAAGTSQRVGEARAIAGDERLVLRERPHRPAGPVAHAFAAAPAMLDRVPMLSTEPVPDAPDPLPVAPGFLNEMVDAAGRTARFPLPGGEVAVGSIDLLERDADGVLVVQGTLTAPRPGFFFFRRETEDGMAGAIFGHARFDDGGLAYRAEPVGADGAPMLVPRRLDQVMCVGLPAMAGQPLEAPQTHPTTPPYPPSQNGIVPLESLPGAPAVIFLDFEGGSGPWEGWGNFAAQPANVSASQIKEVWQRVAEDFQVFNINITTDRRVFEAAQRNRRQRVMVTPTNNAAPGAGGVALYGSFNSSGDAVCWAFYTSGKASAEVISHEVGHTLSLSHDGRHVPGQDRQEYFDGAGYGSGATDWAPIMGVGYGPNLTQWSKGEYNHATNTEDDLAIITTNNNSVAYRSDDYGDSFATGGYLEVQSNGSVVNEGILERQGDVDAFRFTTTGGQVTFNANVVSAGPNVDLQAAIYNSVNGLVASNNPFNELNATVSANLPAGDYTLRISAVGRGNPQTDGYSAYASLGAYLISGSAPNAVKPDRFTVAENTAGGTLVGTVIPRNAHGGTSLGFAITGGNTGGAFSVHPTNGGLRVANASVLDFETLSSRWDRPAVVELFVSITNPANPSLNETVRVVVNISDVNEAPVLAGGSRVVFSRTRVGTEILKLNAIDPDRFDFVSYSIASGNSAGLFAIDEQTGRITLAKPLEVESDTTIPLVVRATDSRTPVRSTDATVTINALRLSGNHRPGGIPRTYFENISGTSVANLTSNAKFPNNPDSQEALGSFDGGEHGDNYGSTITGFLIPPVTGAYTFWIASDDASVLLLSPDSIPANASQRAAVTGWTSRYAFDQTAAQKSAPIQLLAGKPYYIEARHKEGGGGDHVAVAWEGPGFSRETIPGLYLAPHSVNRAPTLAATTLHVRRNAVTGSTVGTVKAGDFNPLDTHTYLVIGGTGSSLFGIEPTSGRVFVKDSAALASNPATSFGLSVRVVDSGSPVQQANGTVTIQVRNQGDINVAGIIRQIWWNFTGSLAELPNDPRYNRGGDVSRVLTSFDGGSEGVDYFGSRIRAYVVPPVTGAYRFYISSDDASVLRMSTSENPAGATDIASVSGWVDPRGWTSQSSQVSTTRNLIAGNRYYIEARHRQGFGGDDLAVAWTGPNIATPTVIPGSAVQPFNINNAPTWNSGSYSFATKVGTSAGTLVGEVAATDPEGEPLTYAILAGNSSGAFAIDPQTGRITIANPAALSPATTVHLTLTAQDGGIGGVYPLMSASRSISISVSGAATAAMEVRRNACEGRLIGSLNRNDFIAVDAFTITGGTGAAMFAIDPTTGAITVNDAAALAATADASRTLVVRATTSGSITVTVTISIIDPETIRLPGVARQIWWSYFGNLANLPNDPRYPHQPSASRTLGSLDAGWEGVANFGSRIRAYVVPPVTGSYRFYLSSDDESVLRLSPNENPEAAADIASVTGWVDPRGWNAQPSQTSAQVTLIAGNRYYLEVRHRQSSGGDDLAVAWTGPGIASPTIIPGSALRPFNINSVPTWTSGGPFAAHAGIADGTVIGQVTATDPEGDPLIYAIVSGNAAGAFAINSATGEIRVVNRAALVVGSTELVVTAQDAGFGGVYPLASATTNVGVSVTAAFASWQQVHFGATPNASANHSADPDGDGLPNLLEYALGLDPMTADRDAVIANIETIGDKRYLRLSVARNASANEVQLEIQVTGDVGGNWTAGEVVIEADTPTLLRGRDTIPLGEAPARFIRLRAVAP